MNQERRILVMIPARNEEAVIGSVIRDVRAVLPDCVPLLLIDLSTDRTEDIARREGARVLKLPISLGIGGAIKAGYRYAAERGFDIALQVDGDGQHDAGEIPRLLEPILARRADLTIGSRFLKKEGFQSTIPRRIGIHMFSTMSSWMCGQRISDCTSGFRAVNRPLLEYYSRYYPAEFPDAEAILQALFSGFRMEEVPVKMRSREFGRSSIGFWKSLYYPMKVMISILVTRFRKHPAGSGG